MRRHCHSMVQQFGKIPSGPQAWRWPTNATCLKGNSQTPASCAASNRKQETGKTHKSQYCAGPFPVRPAPLRGNTAYYPAGARIIARSVPQSWSANWWLVTRLPKARSQSMKRYGNLWDTLVSWPNLLLAARKARTGKRRRPVVARFELQREWHLLKLRDELQAEIYTPRPFTTHRITHPKPRLISAAPYRDRVVHHAIMNVLMPLMDQRLHPSCFACRQAKGTHAAARHVQIMAERNRYAWHAETAGAKAHQRSSVSCSA